MKKQSTITIKSDPSKVKRGHQPHRSGAGSHQDGRKTRLRTRSAQLQRAIKDHS